MIEPIRKDNRLIIFSIFEPNINRNRLMNYIWQLENFPDFSYSTEKLLPGIQNFALELGETNGILQGFSEETKRDVFTELLLSEALKTSEIEGEYFSREEVISSLKLNLGYKDFHKTTKNKKANAIAVLMIEVQKSYNKTLDENLLLDWHKILMEYEESINHGQFRKGKEPMQVVSGSFGNFTVHYEAPPAKDLPVLIPEFIGWYKSFTEPNLGKVGEAMLLAAIAHLYFETLHPFEDGNGRIGRALAEKALAEKLEIPIFVGLSKAIEKDKSRYYNELKKAQRNLQITDWVHYFFDILNAALINSKNVVTFTLKKVRFFDSFQDQLNERQLKAINKMMEQGEEGFEGGMTAKKYISINKTSKATATRDLQQLAEMNAFIKVGAGRSVSYELNMY